MNILLKSGWLPCAGPTCAYSREIFTRFPALRGGLIEDAPLLLRAGLLGRYVPIEDALVNQRLNCGNSGIGFNLNNPKKWNYFLESKIFAFRAMQRDLSSWPAPVKYGDEISREILNLLISASSLFIPEDRRISILDKATFILRALTSPAFGSSFYHRIKSIPYFVLGDESKIFKVLRLIFNLRLKNNDKHILED